VNKYVTESRKGNALWGH